MIDIIASANKVNVLGRLGENEHRRLRFDISEYRAEYPDATYSLLHRPYGTTAAYPVANIDVDETYVNWLLESSDLTAEGQGQCELVILDNGVIAKSEIYLTKVLPALDGSGTVPSPWESWFEQFVELKEAAEAAAEAAAQSAEQAAQYAVRITMQNDVLTIEHLNNNEGVS